MTRFTSEGTAYELSGPGEGMLVVLAHGLGLNRSVWNRLEPTLAQRHRVLRYDLYGHGESPPPPENPTLRLFAGQLSRLIETAGEDSAATIGFSLGGMISRRFAMDYPLRTRALAILNSPHARAAADQRLVEQRAARAQLRGPAAVIEETLARWFTPAFRAEHPEILAEVRRWVLANDPEAYARCRKLLATGVTELIRPDPPITAPTLVITCEHDSGSPPAMSHAIASEIPGAEICIVPALQHMGLVEAPEAFAAPLLRFLDRVHGRSPAPTEGAEP